MEQEYKPIYTATTKLSPVNWRAFQTLNCFHIVAAVAGMNAIVLTYTFAVGAVKLKSRALEIRGLKHTVFAKRLVSTAPIRWRLL